MVKIDSWQRINVSKFWNFAGLALFNISIGLSISIAKADNFVFEDSQTKLAIAKTAVELNSNAVRLEQLASKIDPKTPGRKEALEEISSDISETQETLNQIVENKL